MAVEVPVFAIFHFSKKGRIKDKTWELTFVYDLMSYIVTHVDYGVHGRG